MKITERLDIHTSRWSEIWLERIGWSIEALV